MRSALARGASSPKVRSMDRPALVRTRDSKVVGASARLTRAVGRRAGGLAAPIIDAAANVRRSATRSSRAPRRAATNTIDAKGMAIQAKPLKPASSPPAKTRYVAVMSGSPAPVACRRILVSQHPRRGISNQAAQSNRDALSVDGEGKRYSLRHDPSDEGRAGGAGKLDGQILPDQGRVAGNHHRLGIARPRLK